MNINNLSNLLLSDKSPIVLLVKTNGDRMFRGVAFIVRQKGKKIFIATNRHHFRTSDSPPEEWNYMRGTKSFDQLNFISIHYAESELEDYCIIELKAKKSFTTKVIPLKSLSKSGLANINKLVTIKNSFNGWGKGIEIFNQSECKYRERLKAVVHENNYHTTLYNLRNDEDNKKYQAFHKDNTYPKSIVFTAVSIPGISGSPIIVENGFNEYAAIGINQGGTQGGNFGDLMFFVPASKVIKLLETVK